MRFIQVRDLRTRPAEVWRELADEREMIITSNGKPVAILSSVSETNLEETLTALRRTRAIQAVTELQKQSVVDGRDTMSTEDIEREIQAVRNSRSR
ncbi:MAG: type II toxin-antitoxin system prevent-host-death family antitoxin [Candidatus Latescibacteria bacterium]|nr:type II toxin-antitoxin system prevent-host-death family antitoxin [Candidatus Latescibacterota bacterium]